MRIRRVIIWGVCLIGVFGAGLGLWWHFLALSQATDYSIGEIDPCPSPDGRWLVFRSYTAAAPESGELWIRSALDLSQAPRQLITSSKFHGGVSWSPDSHWFSYTEWTDGVLAGTVESQVFRMNPKTGEKVQLTHGHGQEIKEGTSWSKNNQIAFICGSEICAISPAGGPVNTLSRLAKQNLQITPEEIAWSPDGQRIAFSDQIESENDELRSLWLLNINTGRSDRLTTGPWDSFPVWIDNETVVFCHRPQTQNTLVLSSVDTTSRRVSRIRSDAVYFSSGYASNAGVLYVSRGHRFDWNEKDSNPFRGFHVFRLRSRTPLFW
ncbi:MAG: hypothetical protein P4L51_14240 [Puia sp.]|nr:hypothetical protein [Puia sp.]